MVESVPSEDIDMSNQVYRQNERALGRIVDDEAVILDLDRGVYFGLNDVGTRVWQLVGEGRQLGSICAAIVEEFEVAPDEAQPDVDAFVADLLANGLIQADPNHAEGK
jgi:hypothetical protein